MRFRREGAVPEPFDSVQALRATKRLRDRTTGEWLHKPSPPPLRMVQKGAWTYKEVEPEAASDTAAAPAGR